MPKALLQNLNAELCRLYAAGGSFARSGGALETYLPQLRALGTRIPALSEAADRLEHLLDGEDPARNLMDLGRLVSALYRVQNSFQTEGHPLCLSSVPLPPTTLPLSRIEAIRLALQTGRSSAVALLKEAIQHDRYNDPRLYSSYCRAAAGGSEALSRFIAQTLIPAIGQPIVPFAADAIDIKRSSAGDARLFEVLHTLAERDIVPLAQKVTEGGSDPLLSIAAQFLSQYQECRPLLETGQAADAQTPGARLIEQLQKPSVAQIQQALIQTKDGAVAAEICRQIEDNLPEFEAKSARLKVLLHVLAVRDEPAGLALLEKTLSDAGFYARAVTVLDLHEVVRALYEADTRTKTEMLYRISEHHPALEEYKILTAVRLFPPERVFELLHENITGHSALWSTLRDAYGATWNPERPDSEKGWDRRWAPLFARIGLAGPAAAFIYHDDGDCWQCLFAVCITSLRRCGGAPPYFAEIYHQGLRLGHSGVEAFGRELLGLGYPQGRLLAAIRT